MKLSGNLTFRFLCSCVLALILLIPVALFGPASSYAALPKLDNIRVALFLAGGRFNVTADSVTLQAAQGLTVANRTQGATHTWLGSGQLQTVRASLDRFAIRLPETADFKQALAAYQALAGAGSGAMIGKHAGPKQPLYQVLAGNYPSKDAAAAALTALRGQSALAPLLQNAAVAGSLHWNAGTYTTLANAVQQQAVLAKAGVSADIVYQEDAAGKVTYSVWLGSEADSDLLNQVKQKVLAAVPGLKLQSPAAGAPYLLERADVSQSSDGEASIPYYFLNPNGQKTMISPMQGEITVKEKKGRTYRGGIELSAYNGALAVINELPFEQYLYSVVSTEMGKDWPPEALKAQAVAARTYALAAGAKYTIANVSDSTLDQAYTGAEYPAALQAVDATKGEVLTDRNGLITPYYSANAGGMTADPAEVWGSTAAAYLKSAPSPDDGAAAGKALWMHIVMADGSVGYVHSDYVKDTGLRNQAGLPYFTSTDSGVNVRKAPYVDNSGNPPIGKLNKGDRVIVFGQTTESNDYTWQRGPYDAAWLASQLKGYAALSGGLTRLEVTKRGPSGRATELAANGQAVKVPYPDAYRTALGSLPSTRFEIEETGRYTVLGAGGNTRSFPEAAGSLSVLSAASQTASAVTQKQFFVMGAGGKVHLATKDPQFVFTGQGFGHGLGMSQWGARSYAELGYDYRKILQSYYTGITIVKD